MNNIILYELTKNQRENINYNKKLLYNDIKKISENLNESIFNNNNCCIWQGFITTTNKNNYIHFYFNNKKILLQRLLYLNYVDELNDNEYIKFKCLNKGICCNINHFYVNKKNNINIIENNDKININDKKNKLINNNICVGFN